MSFLVGGLVGLGFGHLRYSYSVEKGEDLAEATLCQPNKATVDRAWGQSGGNKRADWLK